MENDEALPLETPVRFPSELEKLRNEVLQYRESSPAARVRAALELSSMVESILLGSPTRLRQIRLLEAEEEREHEVWRDLVARHAGGTGGG